MERRVVACDQCGQVYTARMREDGTFILPTPSSACAECGGTDFSKRLTERADD